MQWKKEKNIIIEVRAVDGELIKDSIYA